MSSSSNPGAEIITRLGKNKKPGRDVRAGTGTLSIVQLDAVANLAALSKARIKRAAARKCATT
jgi:hypothetical protein